MVVRRMGRWMDVLDERILEHLAEEGWATARTMVRLDGFDASRQRLTGRCRVLAHAGLITPFVDSAEADVWELTGRGELYLRGEVDAELVRPVPAPRPPEAVRPVRWTTSRT